jgi:phosphoribosylamine-glycine ligase
MKAEGTPFVGILYAGIILASDGPRVLEFNCRFGDPETQVLLPLLKTDLLSIAVACIGSSVFGSAICTYMNALTLHFIKKEGRLSSLNVEFETSKVAATVVAASAGYPASYPKGKVISGLKEAEHSGNGSVVVFHAGTAVENDNKDLLVTTGGRVLAVTALGDDLRGALVKSYNAIECINVCHAAVRPNNTLRLTFFVSGSQFEGMQYRKDIGAKKLPTIKIAVLGSTRGTDMQAIIDAISQGIINAKIQLVVSNKSDAYILERAKAHNIPSKCILRYVPVGKSPRSS